MIYWLGEDGSLKSHWNRGYFLANLNANTIGISRGPFGHRGAIYGSAAKNWRIAGIYRIMMDVDCVELEGGLNVTVGKALHLINTYPSLLAMLDRIAELEQELKTANSIRQDWNAANYVLLQIIQADRQFYRSKSSEHIRECLETMREWQKHRESEPSSDKIWCWRNVFHPVAERHSGSGIIDG